MPLPTVSPPIVALDVVTDALDVTFYFHNTSNQTICLADYISYYDPSVYVAGRKIESNRPVMGLRPVEEEPCSHFALPGDTFSQRYLELVDEYPSLARGAFEVCKTVDWKLKYDYRVTASSTACSTVSRGVNGEVRVVLKPSKTKFNPPKPDGLLY